MSGTISSADARVLVADAQPEVKAADGQISSHDLLKEPLVQEVKAEEQPAVDNLSTTETPVEAKTEELKKKEEGPNFRTLRQKAEAIEREAREKDEIIQRLLRQNQQQAQPQQQEQPGYDEILERRHLSPLEQRLQALEKEHAQLRQFTAAELSKREMKSKYADFDQVMSEDNLRDLEYMDPAVARALKSSSDFEGASKIAYHMIKSLGIHKEASTMPINYEVDKKRVAENLAKPKPLSALGKSASPLGALSPYHREQTKEHKDMLWAKMQKKLRTKKSF